MLRRVQKALKLRTSWFSNKLAETLKGTENSAFFFMQKKRIPLDILFLQFIGKLLSFHRGALIGRKHILSITADVAGQFFLRTNRHFRFPLFNLGIVHF
jgi:hypothetical protein